MRKKFLTAILAVGCAVCGALGFTACKGDVPASGNKTNNTSGKANEFIRITDGVFALAGYTKASARTAEVSVLSAGNTAIDELYSSVKNDGNTLALSANNANYIKCDTLYQWANLAGLFRAMAQVLGDEVFSAVYDLNSLGMANSFSKLEENNGYTLYGVSYEGDDIASAIQIDFNEYEAG